MTSLLFYEDAENTDALQRWVLTNMMVTDEANTIEWCLERQQLTLSSMRSFEQESPSVSQTNVRRKSGYVEKEIKDTVPHTRNIAQCLAFPYPPGRY